MTIVEFLRARLNEDEAVATAAHDPDLSNAWMLGFAEGSALSPGDRVMFHPARVLAEVEAKRRLIRQWLAHEDRLAAAETSVDAAPEEVMAAALTFACAVLAVPFAGHPDYDEAWRP